MKKFLSNFLLFGLCFFLMDKLFFIPMLVNPELIIDQRIHQALKGEHQAEILILGSSRAARNILAGEIEEKTGRKSLNFSYPGSNLEFHEFLLRLYLNNQDAPNTIFLTLDDYSSFLEDPSLEFRLDQLYPLSIYSQINSEFVSREERSPLAYFFALGRVSKSTFDFGQQTFTKFDSLSSNGSMPVSFQNESFDRVFNHGNLDYPKENEVKSRLKAFSKIQELCQVNDIRLILVFPPNFKNLNPLFFERVKELTFYGEIYVYEQLDPTYNKESYFHDANHLMKEGAEIFTQQLVEYLKKNPD
jgi:hypothetical protein